MKKVVARGAERDEPVEERDTDPVQLGVQSIEIGMQLMEAMVDHAFDSPPPMLKTLAAQARMPPAKAHRYMVSFVRAQLVEKDVVTGRYQLGPMARLMGMRAIQSVDVVKLVAPRLPVLCSELGFSVALAIWAHDGPTIIAVEDARRHITVGTRVGEVMPLVDSATGQVFGAWSPPRLTQDLIKRNLAARNRVDDKAHTKVSVEQLYETVRSTGLGVTVGGLNRTVNALSAPIFDYRGGLVAALSTLGPAPELDADRRSPLAVKLKAFAAEFSHELGYTPELAAAPSETKGTKRR